MVHKHSIKKDKSKSSTKSETKFKINSKIIIAIVLGVVGPGLAIYLISSQNNNSQSLSLAETQTAQAYAEKIIDNCKDSMHCSVMGLDNLSKTEKPQMVLGAFSDLVMQYDHSQYPCHETAHHLGMWLYGYTQNLNESLSYAKMLCGGAVFHGILENYFLTQQLHNVDESQIDVKQLCPQSPDNPYSMLRWQCLHGVGHGLSAFYNENVTTAVTHCDVLKPGWEQLSCSKGVFMQNVVRYYETGEGEFKKNDVYFPCDTVSTKYAPACYHYHTSYLLKQTNFDIPAAFDLCDKITPDTMVKYCYYGMGRELSSAATPTTLPQTIATCYLGKESSYHVDCVRGMLMTILNRDTNTYWGFKFCSIVDDNIKQDCYDSLGKWVKMLYPTPQQREMECAKAENLNYTATCENASLDTDALL